MPEDPCPAPWTVATSTSFARRTSFPSCGCSAARTAQSSSRRDGAVTRPPTSLLSSGRKAPGGRGTPSCNRVPPVNSGWRAQPSALRRRIIARKQQPGMLRLDAQVLLHHGRVGVAGGSQLLRGADSCGDCKRRRRGAPDAVGRLSSQPGAEAAPPARCFSAAVPSWLSKVASGACSCSASHRYAAS